MGKVLTYKQIDERKTNLKTMRKMMGLNQTKLAEKLGIDQVRVCKMEAGYYPITDKVYSGVLLLWRGWKQDKIQEYSKGISELKALDFTII